MRHALFPDDATVLNEDCPADSLFSANGHDVYTFADTALKPSLNQENDCFHAHLHDSGLVRQI